jgi:alpha-ketoglutarate-dependent taurine dioxygenase
MAVFGYVESHRERWTISDSEAGKRSPRNPVRNAFGHLAELSSETLGGENRRIFSPEDNYEADVIVMAQPGKSLNEVPSRECDDEVASLLEFVHAGGGLFIMVGYSKNAGVSIGARLAEHFGICVTGHRLFTQADDDSCLLSDAVLCDDVKQHQATRGVHQIISHCGLELRCSGESLAVINTPAGETIFAVGSYGLGKVAVVGSSELFALPYVGETDNAVLYLSTLAWLVDGEASQGSSPGQPHLVRRLVRENGYSPCIPGRPGSLSGGTVPMLSVIENKRELQRLYRQGLNPYERTEEFLARAELAYHELPEFVRRKIREFRDESNDFGALLITGLPSDHVLPSTPAVPSVRPLRQTYMSEFWLAVFSSPLGEQVGYEQESAGALFQNVIPTRANAENLSSESSHVPLGLHTEIAFHPVMPDYVLLYCLRPARDGDAITLVAGARSMISLLTPKCRTTLFQRAFRTGIDHSYGSPNGHAGNGPLVCILHGDPFDPLMRLDPDLMLGDDVEARTALAEIGTASRACEVPVALATSDLLLIDNRRAVHGRSSFNVYYDGQDRWLQRSFVVQGLDRFSAECKDGTRVISTVFAV